MANQLKMAKTHAIIGLLEQGWSYRRIARELGVDRATVARYDRFRSKSPSNPAIAAPGSPGADLSNPAISTPGFLLRDLIPPESRRLPGRVSDCEPFKAHIESGLTKGLTAQRIFQDLRGDHGFTGSYSSVKRYARRLEASTPLPFRRMETEPGVEAQVDFGSGAWIIGDGQTRRPHVLRVTLSYSRKSYSEPVFRQTTENFIRCLENAFRHFGGVPKTLVIDNLRAAVKCADWFDPDINPKVAEFARHYGTAILPTKPYTPWHKGKVENGIKYVKSNALKGRTFTSLEEQRQFLLDWETTVADTRVHGSTKKQVQQMFLEERSSLNPLPSEPFPFFHESQRKVHRDGHVEVDRGYYSVPPEYLGREVWVRWDSRLVRVFNQRFEQIAVHAKVLPGRFNTSAAHISDKKISAVERGVDYMLSQATRIGKSAAEWATAMLEERGIEGVRVLQGFLSLAKKHPAQAINQASQTALNAHMFRLKPLRMLIQHRTDQPQFDFAEEHDIIRPLAEYQHILERNAHEPTDQDHPEATQALWPSLYP